MRAVIASLFFALFSAQAQTVVDGGSWTYNIPGAQNFATITATVPDGTTTATRVTTLAATPDTPWYSQASRVLAPSFEKGQWLRFRLWARSDSSNRLGLVHELNSGDYRKALSYSFRLTNEWKEYAISYQSIAFTTGSSALRIQTGFDSGTVELANIQLEDFASAANPPNSINFDAYGGQPADDAWRDSAQQRIEQYRKGNLVISVVDGDGNPVPGAAIHVEQQRQGFRFGTAIADGPLFANTGDGDKYRSQILRLFNYVVLENALKWEWGSFNTADKMLAWCANNNLPVRGHNLLWPDFSHLPASSANLRGAALRSAVEAHIRDYSARTIGRVVLWDVINEAFTNTSVLNSAGQDLLWQSYVWAHEVNPDIDLVYNDFDLSNSRAGANDAHLKGTLAIIQKLLDNSAPVTLLGDQSHMGTPLTPIPRVLEIWDQMAQFGLPIEVTEFDVVFGGPRDEAAQAKYFDDFMTAAFSHPNMKSLVMWGFWDGAHWLSSQGAGMFRQDWTRRPMADVYEQRVLNDWWTRADAVSANDGTAQIRAFLGTHQITVTVNGQTYMAPVEIKLNQDQVTAVTITAN